MKKFIDRDGRVFGKISVVDLLVLAFLILAGVSLYLKLNVLDTTQTVQPPAPSSMPTIQIQVTASNIADYVAEALQIGDEVYDQGNFDAGVLGVITDIQIQDSSYLREMAGGRLTPVAGAEDYCNAVLTLECHYTESNGFVLLNGDYPVGFNASRTFNTKYALFSGAITRVG